MFARSLLTAFTLSLCTAASASCFDDGTPMFHCTFEGGTKTIDICLQGEVVIYSFGKTGNAADIILARREIGVEMTPWNGIGRTIWEEISLYSGAYSYNVSYASDRNVESAPIEGRLIVGEGDSEVVDLQCDTGSVTVSNFYPLFEAKEAAGQHYCQDTFSWGQGC